MPAYSYRGVSTHGRTVSGVIDADSLRAARARLRERGILASDLTTAADTSSTTTALHAGLQRGVRVGELSRTMRQLATLLGAGIPLVDAVTSLRNQQVSPRMANTLESVRAHLIEGGSLETAMAKHPAVFPSIYTGMVRAGESSGSLDRVLVRIAEHAEGGARLQSRLRAAMTYPIVMAVVGTLIVVFLLSYVVPQVTRVFADAGQKLPLPTRFLMALAGFVAAYGLAMLAALTASLVALRFYRRTPSGRRRVERIMHAVPIAGNLMRTVAMARFAQTMSTMLAGGLPLVDALEVSRSVVGSALLSDELEAAKDAVTEGDSLSGHLRASRLFHPMVVDMIAVGERSGELETMLERAAAILDEETKVTVDTLASLLEPVTIVIMAGIVLFVVLAVLLPVFEMNQLVR